MSEEEYLLLKSIVRRFVPETEFDLSTLRELAGCSEQAKHPSASPGIDIINEALSQPFSEASNVHNGSGRIVSGPDGLVAEEIEILHGDLGCMMVDSSGEYSMFGILCSVSLPNETTRICRRRLWDLFQCSCPSIGPRLSR